MAIAYEFYVFRIETIGVAVYCNGKENYMELKFHVTSMQLQVAIFVAIRKPEILIMLR